jgi:hypothetical protein
MNRAESEPKTAADIEGPWADPKFTSSLIERCRSHWTTPIGELSDEVLATFLRQEIALRITIPEARRRLAAGVCDDTELYDGELAESLARGERSAHMAGITDFGLPLS